MDQIRLNKYVSNSGLCTRREAAHRIKGGQIKVDGEIIKDPATLISSSAKVTFGSKVLYLPTHYTYILVNKPKKTLSKNESVEGTKTVARILGNKVEAPVVSVCPLKENDMGLLLLTDDPGLKNNFESAKNKGEEVFHVFLEEEFSLDHFAEANKVPWIQSIYPFSKDAPTELQVSLDLNSYSLLYDYLEQLGYQVIKMDRLYFAGLTKKDLSRDRFRHLTEREVVMIKHFT